MPSRVIACAKHRGLNVSMYVDSGFYAGAMHVWFPNELEACKAQGVKINKGKSPGPTVKERELEIFSTVIVGLHYVLRRPASEAKTYMDPADGTNYVNAGAMNAILKMYKTTGVPSIFHETAAPRRIWSAFYLSVHLKLAIVLYLERARARSVR